MFVNRKELIRAIKIAWKLNALKIAKIGDIVVLRGTFWRWAAAEEKVTKDVLGEIVKCTGILPEEGVQYDCGKDIGNQITVFDIISGFIENDIVDLDKEGNFEITDIMIGNRQVVKYELERETKATSVQARLVGLVEDLKEDESGSVMQQLYDGKMIYYNGTEELVLYPEDIEEYKFVLEKLAEVL